MLKDLREGSDLQTDAAAAPPAAGKSCSISGCTGRYLARGFCIKHYYQVKRHGSVRTDSSGPSRRLCKADGCMGMSHALGYCARHYGLHWRVTAATPTRRPAPVFRDEHRCRDGACPEAPFSQGLCRLHYIMSRYQDLVT